MNDLSLLIARLKKHNQWRRGEIELTHEELNPKQIGEDIDEAIFYLEAISYEEVYPNFQNQNENNKYLIARLARSKSAPDLKVKPPEFITINEGYHK